MKVPGPFRPVCRSEGDDLNPIIEIVFESEDRNPTIGMTCVFAFLVSAEYILYYRLYYIILYCLLALLGKTIKINIKSGAGRNLTH